MLSWLKLQRKDYFAYIVASIIGFFVGRLIPDHAWATYTAILLSYHLFLVWLVVSGEEKAGMSLHIVSTIVTHAACMFLAVAVTMARHYIPFFSYLRFGVSAIALFEYTWLFTGAKRKPAAQAQTANVLAQAVGNVPSPAAASKPEAAAAPKPAPAPVADPIASATGEDHEAWLRYLQTRNPTHRKAGLSMSEEYRQWLLARTKKRAAEAATQAARS